MPDKLSKILETKGDFLQVKTQQLYEKGKVILVIKDGMNIDTVLFDNQGNAVHYEDFSLTDQEV